MSQRPHFSAVTRIAVFAHIAMDAIVDAPIRRCSVVHEPVFVHDFVQVPTGHINDYSIVLQEMTHVLPGRRMQLTVNQIGNMPSRGVEDKFHLNTPPSLDDSSFLIEIAVS